MAGIQSLKFRKVDADVFIYCLEVSPTNQGSESKRETKNENEGRGEGLFITEQPRLTLQPQKLYSQNSIPCRRPSFLSHSLA